MSNTKKVYPAHPAKQSVAPKYGSKENPKMSSYEREILKLCFAEIFLFGPKDSDPYTELAKRIGCDRPRAKQLYWMFIWQEKGHFFNHVARERKIRAKLIIRIKDYTKYLDNPETVYQIIARAEDEVDEDERIKNGSFSK